MKIPKEKCIKCKGKGGFIKGLPSKHLNSSYWVKCNKCNGKRELDWVEMAMASRPITMDEFYDYLRNPQQKKESTIEKGDLQWIDLMAKTQMEC